MTDTTLSKTARTIIATTTRAAGGAATRGAIDLRTPLAGSILTTNIKNNGALGAQCVCIVSIAHDDGATPAVGAVGSVWKEVWRYGGETASGKITPSTYTFPAGVQHAQVEFDGNTTNSCDVEAYLSEATKAVSTP